MDKKLRLDFVLFDVIGTTIMDTRGGKSIILESFGEAFYRNGIQVETNSLQRERGKTKIEAIRNILNQTNSDAKLLNSVYEDFIDLLNHAVQSFQAVSGARELFALLKKKDIKVGLGSGLPLVFIHTLIKQVDWRIEDFDYINSSESLGRGRPDPIMIHDAMTKLRMGDKSKVLKIGDTLVDVQEGKNAGVLTASVLSGTARKEDLEKQEPDFIFRELKDMIEVI